MCLELEWVVKAEVTCSGAEVDRGWGTTGSRGCLGPSLLQRVWSTKVVFFFSPTSFSSLIFLLKRSTVLFFWGGTPLFCGNCDEEGTSVGHYESQEYKQVCEA